MPDAGQGEDDAEIEEGPAFALAVAAQGKVDVLLEPGAERDVPAAPELGDGQGPVGKVEVVLEVEAEEPCRADGNVRVAGEVVVDFQGVEEPAEPGRRGVDGCLAGDFSDVGPEGIGQDDLLRKADDDAVDAGHKAVCIHGPGLNLRLEVFPLHDGAGHYLRKESNVKRRVKRAAGRGISPVDIDEVGDGRKYDEGNPEEGLRFRRPTQVYADLPEEGPVLAVDEDIEDGRNRDRQYERGPAFPEALCPESFATVSSETPVSVLMSPTLAASFFRVQATNSPRQ